MSETKKDNSQEAIKQLAVYKTTGLADSPQHGGGAEGKSGRSHDRRPRTP